MANAREVVTVQLGSVCVTRKAARRLDKDEAFAALGRHMGGDWGNVEYQDWKSNDEALEFGGRIVSSYRDRHLQKFWIITEADRSLTTILLPEEY